MGRVTRFVTDVWTGTLRRLRRVPLRLLRLLRWIVVATVGPPATENPHYAELRAKTDRGERLTIEDINEVVVPLLVSRGREIQRLRIEAMVPYALIVVMLVVFAFVGQRILEGTRKASRVNCTVIDNVVRAAGVAGSPTPTAEINALYRAEIEDAMGASRLRRLRSLQDQVRRSGVRVEVPDCDALVSHPESIRPVTIAEPTR